MSFDSPWGRFFLAALAAGLLGMAHAAHGAEPIRYGTDGNVLAMAVSGNTVYLGGTFTIAGPLTGGGIVVSEDSAKVLQAPGFAGLVRAVVADGSGGWFVGGSFVGVADQPIRYLAHVLPDGSIANWNPGLDGMVFALALDDGVLYVGGAFHEAAGEPRSGLAAFDAVTGQVKSWNPQSNSFVRALYVHGSSIYAGGPFTLIGGLQRNHLARLSKSTGAPEEWPVDADADVACFTSSNDTLYVGGYFLRFKGVLRSYLAAIDLNTDSLLALDAHPVAEEITHNNGEASRIDVMQIVGGSLFVGGHFIGMGGQSRMGLAELDRVTGDATDWSPALGPYYPAFASPSVHALLVRGHELLVGGGFAEMNGQPRGYAARFDLGDGALLEWNPPVTSDVYALAGSSNSLFIGGWFSIAGAWQPRSGLAAIDATTGALLPWDPGTDAFVITALAVAGGKVYVSGDFFNIGGQPRTFMAALDSATGAATSWDPRPNNIAVTMLLHGDALLAGGYFTSIGGASRPYAAKLDTAQGAALDWDAHCDDEVLSIVATNDAVYLGGWFRHAGGEIRNRLAAVDVESGALLPWNPNADGLVTSLAEADSFLFVAGKFSHIGSEAHKGLAAVRLDDSAPQPWNLDLTRGPNAPPPQVNTLLVTGNTVLVGGLFTTIGGEDASMVATLDASSGQIRRWRADLDNGAWCSTTDGDRIWVGGSFTIAGASLAGGIFSLDVPRQPPPTTRSGLALAQSRPNPASTSALIAFSLPTASRVTLIVYDLQGRRVAAPLLETAFSAGPHEVTVATGGWRPGCYLYRLEADGRSATRKILVVQ